MVDVGRGTTTVALAHGGGSDLCETLDFATQLVAKGYRIVAFDFRGDGRSQSPSRNRLGLGRVSPQQSPMPDRATPSISS
jgi:pimeloyl-ACP methyl ester carboxylesterase